MSKCSCCLERGEETEATFDSPALLCDGCWHEWWYAPPKDDPIWDELFERWNKSNPRSDDSGRDV